MAEWIRSLLDIPLMGFVRRSAAIYFAACCLLTALTFDCPSALADNISIDVFVEARDRQVSVRLTNVGRDTASSLSISLEFLGKKAAKSLPPLAPSNYSQAVFEVEYPNKEGSYPLYTTVNYLNDGKTMSLVNVGAYHYGRPRVINRELNIPDLVLRKQAALVVSYDTAYKLRLMLPREIEVLREEDVPGGKKFSLKNNRPSFNSDYTIFAALLTPEDSPEAGLKIATANLKAREYSDISKPLSSPVYLVLAVLAYLGACFFYKGAALDFPPQAPKVALIRALFSISVVSLLYFGFCSLHVLPDYLSAIVPNACLKIPVLGAYLSQAASVLLRWLYFEGKDYDYFSSYVALPLYLYMLIGNYFVLRYIIRPEPKNDKYWHLMLSCFSVTPWIRQAIAKKTKKLPYWSSYSKVAVLTLMVKAFYVPLLTSWSINNVIHQGNLIRRFDWSFHEVNEFLVALFILVDVVIFAFGYLTELPRLKNQIRSVEPTILGWAVCIMCYPPFNQFAFAPFDEPLLVSRTPPSEAWQMTATAAITVLWGIYVWATVALGFKASNLTNRGIVATGPYAYVRHPAYISKVSLWALSAYFLGEFNFFLVVTFIVVYFLRAWTEERHLSLDPDYRAYKKQVPYRFIPRLF